jgi:hypothetical protein
VHHFILPWRAIVQSTCSKKSLLFASSSCILEIKMNAHPQFFAFTYRYWFSIAALADVHI